MARRRAGSKSRHKYRVQSNAGDTPTTPFSSRATRSSNAAAGSYCIVGEIRDMGANSQGLEAEGAKERFLAVDKERAAASDGDRQRHIIEHAMPVASSTASTPVALAHSADGPLWLGLAQSFLFTRE